MNEINVPCGWTIPLDGEDQLEVTCKNPDGSYSAIVKLGNLEIHLGLVSFKVTNVCEQCGKLFDKEIPNYCPNCGNKMLKEVD